MSKDEVRITTPPGVLVFGALLKPRKKMDPKPGKPDMEYDATVVFDEATQRTTEWKNMVAQYDEAIKEFFGREEYNKYSKMKPPQWRNAIRDGDEKDLEKYPVFEGKKFLSGSTSFKVPIVHQDGKRLLEEVYAPEDMENEIYPGCIVRVKFAVRGYRYKLPGSDTVASRGGALGLRFIQLVKKGERLQIFESHEGQFESLPEDNPGLEAQTETPKRTVRRFV